MQEFKLKTSRKAINFQVSENIKKKQSMSKEIMNKPTLRRTNGQGKV